MGHVKYSELYRLYGAWPPARYKELTEEEQQAFWKRLRETNGLNHVQKLVEETITISKVDQTGNKTKGEYLPLSVYRKQGWNTKRIKKRCTDVISDPIFGKLYRIQKRSSYEVNMEEHNHAKVVGGNTGPRFPATKVPNNKSKDMETVRAEKAIAAEQARRTVAAKKVASKWLGKFVKLGFNLNSITGNKYIRRRE